MRDAQIITWADADAGAHAPRARILLVSTDRRFRSVAATLLAQRGHVVSVTGRGVTDGTNPIAGADVVVIDGGASQAAAARQAARLQALRPPVRVITVSGEGDSALPVLSKWSSFDAVLTAIEAHLPAPDRAGEARVAA